MSQSEFDFDAAERERALTEHWERLEKLARVELSEENLCLAWVTDSDGRAWRDWWDAQPSYERSRMLSAYRAERGAGGPMRPYFHFVPSREELAAEEEIIEYFGHGIREAAIQRRPMPFRESRDMTGFERIVYRCRLNAAMRRENVVIIEAQPCP